MSIIICSGPGHAGHEGPDLQILLIAGDVQRLYCLPYVLTFIVDQLSALDKILNHDRTVMEQCTHLAPSPVLLPCQGKVQKGVCSTVYRKITFELGTPAVG